MTGRYRAVTRDLGFGIVEERLYDGHVLVEKRRIEPAGATPVARAVRRKGHKNGVTGAGTT